MGCLNSEGKFDHWFANIHFSGPCNRSCYWCIGQHMQELEKLNNLNTWPLDGIDKFIEECNSKHIKEVNLTGSNTDPMLYKHTEELKEYLCKSIPGLVLGVRTNGALILDRPELWNLYDKASLSIHSIIPEVYKKIMGSGNPPDMAKIIDLDPNKDIKVNIVLCPENKDNLLLTIVYLSKWIKRINLREPYGQPHVGNPLADLEADYYTYGMPAYKFGDTIITYWDIHYCEVESVNLYANGNVSNTYPITKGYSEKEGKVLDQAFFHKSGRQFEQWQY